MNTLEIILNGIDDSYSTHTSLPTDPYKQSNQLLKA